MKRLLPSFFIVIILMGLWAQRSAVNLYNQTNASHADTEPSESVQEPESDPIEKPILAPVPPQAPAISTPVSPSPGPEETKHAVASGNLASRASLLESSLLASIRMNFPGYRFPDTRDIVHAHTAETLGTLPFLCWGDFNGDGLRDAAVVIANERDWRLVIFEQNQRDQYLPAFVARPRKKADLGRYWDENMRIAPQQAILRTISRGEAWTPAAGEGWQEIRPQFDAIEFVGGPTANTHFATLIFAEAGVYRQGFGDPLLSVNLRDRTR
jgi:hypothetical protein